MTECASISAKTVDYFDEYLKTSKERYKRSLEHINHLYNNMNSERKKTLCIIAHGELFNQYALNEFKNYLNNHTIQYSVKYNDHEDGWTFCYPSYDFTFH